MNVLVIGGGFAGLAAAVALAARGHTVRLLESAPTTGGKARALVVAGARIDLGPTLLADLEPLRTLCTLVDEHLDRITSFARLDPALVATFPGGKSFALHADPAVTSAALAPLGPEARDDWERFLGLGARAARLTAHFYACGDVAGPRDFLRFVLARGARLDDVAAFARYGSLDRLLAAHVRTPELRRWLSHCARFLGIDADRAPAVAVVIPYVFATGGVWYPQGGVAALADALRDLAVKHGARVETGAAVAGLEVAGGRVRAALTAEGHRIPADACVAAVDAGLTACWLTSGPVGFRATPTYAARVAWWVIEATPARAHHHAFHFTADDEQPVYVAVPTVTDPALAADGAAVYYALLHGAPGARANAAFADQVRARLERAGAWPTGRLLAHGVAGGAASCYGSAIGPGLFASFRPSQRVRGVSNLVRAGGSVFPGPGISNVIRSGLRAAELIERGVRA